MDLISNPWVIGIGGGILSGLIVGYISKLIFSNRDTREYAQKVSRANHEVLYAVRSGISEGVIPTNRVLKSLIEATARKYSVDLADVYDLDDVSSELIREVMDSSFIAASAKQEFCEKLIAIKNENISRERSEIETRYDISNRYRRQLILISSAMVGVLTGIVSAEVALDSTSALSFRNLAFMAVPALVVILVSIAAVLVKKLQRMRLESFTINAGGVNAEFKPKREVAKNSKANFSPTKDDI